MPLQPLAADRVIPCTSGLSWEPATYRTPCGRYEIERDRRGHWQLTWFADADARSVQLLGEWLTLNDAQHVAAAHAAYRAVADATAQAK